MEELKQHVQVPNMDLRAQGLTHSDPYIYACIKRHMNNETKQAYPQISTLVKESGLDRKTIMKGVKRLEDAGYISIARRIGTSSIYTFNDYKKFEIFSFDFLTDTKLSVKEKSYLVAAQQYMFKDSNIMSGGIAFTNTELADKIGLSLNTLKKCEKSLQDKHILTLVPTQKRDTETGLNVYQRFYDFEQYLNIIALKFNEIDSTLESHDAQINKMQSEIDSLKKTINILLKEKQMKETEMIEPITL